MDGDQIPSLSEDGLPDTLKIPPEDDDGIYELAGLWLWQFNVNQVKLRDVISWAIDDNGVMLELLEQKVPHFKKQPTVATLSRWLGKHENIFHNLQDNNDYRFVCCGHSWRLKKKITR